MDRSKPRGKPQILPTILTFLISAAWHGLATGMFVAFFMCSLLDQITKAAGKTKISAFMDKNVPFLLWWPLKWYYLFWHMSYLVMCMDLYFFEKFNFVHRNLYYVGHFTLPLAVFVFNMLPREKKPTKE